MMPCRRIAAAMLAAMLGPACAPDSKTPSPALPAASPASSPLAVASSAPPAPEVPTAAPSAEATATPPPSACPADMVTIQGEYCPRLVQVCVARRKPWQCAEFQAPSVCQGPTQPKHYCIDRYEFPNRAGEVPAVMSSWRSAKAECAAIGKRLCTEAEWTLACEGPERLPFPYGFVRDASACSIDKRSPRVNEQRLFSPRTQAAELARLDQREPSGSRERCASAFGVNDLTGNVDELVVNETGVPYKSARKGGNWGEYRNACRPSTRGHDEGFRYYQTGFRCCRDPAAQPPPSTEPGGDGALVRGHRTIEATAGKR